MRQNRTVIASSREARVGVCCGWVIRGSFRRGVGWPPFYLILNPRNTHLGRAVYRNAELAKLPEISPQEQSLVVPPALSTHIEIDRRKEVARDGYDIGTPEQ